MPITISEMLECEEVLRQDIAEKQNLLDTFQTIRGQIVKGRAFGPAELIRAFMPARTPLQPNVSLLASAAATLEAAAPHPQVSAARPEPYRNEELRDLAMKPGRTTAAVRWAIARMNADYSLHDIANLLRNEGFPVPGSQLSVVLTRLKARGEIEEIRRSAGPHPALFRGPEFSASADEIAATAAAPREL